MCGFVGFFSPSGKPFCDEPAATLGRANDAIRHRGPDDADIWVSDGGHVGFGFRRLAIIDLSNEGRQPMRSRSGRYTIVFNGEIYNFQRLRDELEVEGGTAWRGHSDTEVLLELIERRGLEGALQKVDGMFALALWDGEARALTLARDRFGEKPLYYGWSEGGLVFASELKAMRALPGFRGELDQTAIARMLRLTYIPGPQTAYEHYRKLPPAGLVTFDGTAETGAWPETKTYWSAHEVMRAAQAKPFEGDYEAVLDQTEKVLRQSVADHLISDVPIGAFLSGGVDSSLTVACAMEATGQPLKTFTIGFDEERYNEAPYARAVADHLGAVHEEITVREADVLSFLDELPSIYDEPFADASQLPTTLLCRRVREHVTVAVSGDGGDEMFCGYGRYLDRPVNWLKQNPAKADRAKALAGVLPVDLLDGLHALRGKPGKLGRKMFASLMAKSASTPEAYFLGESSFWRDGVPINGVERNADLLSFVDDPMIDGSSPLARFMFMDSRVYLTDDLMVKVDRAAMSTSLEVRTPFLNADLAALAWSIPEAHFDPTRFGLKRILRDLLKRRLPADLVDRPKAGFEVPLRHWLRKDLRAWGDELIADPGATASDLLDLKRIAARWKDHQRGANLEGDLWPALTLMQWLRAQA